MTNLTKSEEDYLKALFSLSQGGQKKVGNNQLADYLELSPASVNNMVKKLSAKELVNSERYGKLELSAEGRALAVSLIRKHRLWETFLYDHLNFRWDEVHEVAEQLEHIKSTKLIEELDRFMDYPQKDPHGEIIPDADGSYRMEPRIRLSKLAAGDQCQLVAVDDDSVAFLQYVTQLGLALSTTIEVLELREFDGSIKIKFDDSVETVSKKFADLVFVKRLEDEA
ncbi:metal-dependent transcriptional regulator [Croceiramulus getboli]|nr:metal-dependent transcriptional regulator [Flavobacteriaceae bacterium YJPT1-3]